MTLSQWFCDPCLNEASTSALPLEIKYKPNANSRKSARTSVRSKDLNYANLHEGLEPDPNRWANVVRSKRITPSPFRHVKGSDLNQDWVENDPSAMTEPIIIDKSNDLDMSLPKQLKSVKDVADAVGHEMPVEVIGMA